MTLAAALLGAWLRYEVEGLEHIPRHGGALLISPHGLVPWDGLLLGARIQQEVGRTLRGMSHRYWFRAPGLGPLLARRGFAVGSRERAAELLRQGELLHTMPGGVPEAFRPSADAYTLRWGARTGYLRLAHRCAVPLIPACTGGIDDLYAVSDKALPLTGRLFPDLGAPIPLARGVGPVPWPLTLPRRGHLLTLIGAPIPVEIGDEQDEATWARAHQQVITRVQALWREAQARLEGSPRSG